MFLDRALIASLVRLCCGVGSGVATDRCTSRLLSLLFLILLGLITIACLFQFKTNRNQRQNDEHLIVTTRQLWDFPYRLLLCNFLFSYTSLIETIRYRWRFQQLDEWRAKEILLSASRYTETMMEETRRDKRGRATKEDEEERGEKESFKVHEKHERVLTAENASSGTIFCWTQVPASIGQKIVVPTSGEIMYGPSALAAISYIIISISPYFVIVAWLYY